jgi:hypothetical protein
VPARLSFVTARLSSLFFEQDDKVAIIHANKIKTRVRVKVCGFIQGWILIHK